MKTQIARVSAMQCVLSGSQEIIMHAKTDIARHCQLWPLARRHQHFVTTQCYLHQMHNEPHHPKCHDKFAVEIFRND